jgi:hypothetical protein
MKWSKIPGFYKWIGKLDGVHVASITPVDGEWRVWVLTPIGWSQLQNPIPESSNTTRQVKGIAEKAYEIAPSRIAQMEASV